MGVAAVVAGGGFDLQTQLPPDEDVAGHRSSDLICSPDVMGKKLPALLLLGKKTDLATTHCCCHRDNEDDVGVSSHSSDLAGVSIAVFLSGSDWEITACRRRHQTAAMAAAPGGDDGAP
ncbi:hypothetical protein ACLOJK_026952 [Asimina triloba]